MKLSNGLVIIQLPDLSKITDEQKQHCRDWITALRSGEYAQDQHKLRGEKGFCCLGVGCDVICKAGLGQWDNRGGWWFGTGDIVDCASLTNYGAEYFGFPSKESGCWGLVVECQKNGRFVEDSIDFTVLNDVYNATFEDIALIIEKALEGVIVNETFK